MTDDAMIRHVLGQLSSELREGREYMQSLAHEVSVVGNACGRIEAQLSVLAGRLEDLREDHNRVCVEIAETDRVMMRRISKIEGQATWVRAWAAGAAAVVVTVGSALMWAAMRLPEFVSLIGGK